jgi:hypothetical protein
LFHYALLVSSAHNKLSTGGRYINGEHLDRGLEKAVSRTTIVQAMYISREFYFPVSSQYFVLIAEDGKHGRADIHVKKTS